MNKKATLFMMVLVVVTLIGFSSMLVVLYGKTGTTENIGSRQMAVMRANSELHNAMTYIDLATVYVLRQTEYDMAKHGAKFDSACGSYLGYEMWNKGSQLCMPSAKDEYKLFFEDNLRTFLASYPAVFIPSDFTYSIIGNRITATPLRPLSKALVDEGFGISVTATPVIVGDFAWPSSTDTVVTSCLGERNIDYGSKVHEGIDLRAKVGSPVFAIANGTVDRIVDDWGKLVISHKDGLTSTYTHNTHIYVKKGDKVVKGQVIATAGNKAPPDKKYAVHIHFEARKYGKLVDPIESIFGIEAYNLQFKKTSNCYYNKQNYAYEKLIEANLLES